jgi:transcriptional regulator with XRE-family HTH domain
LTASGNKCVRNPILSESKSESESNTAICSELQAAAERKGGNEVYLSQNLRYLRENKDMSQGELAEHFGLSASAIGNWENDIRTPDIEMIVKLARYFEVSLDELVLKNMVPPEPMQAKNLKYLRNRYGVTLKEMAKLLSVTEATSCKYENGKIEMPIDKLMVVSDYFGITLDQLVKQDLSAGGD